MSRDGDLTCSGSDCLVADVAALFNLGQVRRWRDLGGSRTTNVLMATDRRQVVARVHRADMTIERLIAEQAARTILAQSGIPTLAPMADTAGRTINTLGNGRLVEIERFVNSNGRMNTPPLLLAGFATLARIHDVLRDSELPPAAARVSAANHIGAAETVAATLRGAERIRGWGDNYLTQFADRATALIDAVAEAERPLLAYQVCQLVHGDFWDNNVLFANNKIAAVLDFGFMAERPRVDDLALPFWFYLLEPCRGLPTSADQKVLRELIDAYDRASRAPLSTIERRSIPLAIARQPAWSIGRWVIELEEGEAVRHARSAASELPVAQAIIDNVTAWQDALLHD